MAEPPPTPPQQPCREGSLHFKISSICKEGDSCFLFINEIMLIGPPNAVPLISYQRLSLSRPWKGSDPGEVAAVPMRGAEEGPGCCETAQHQRGPPETQFPGCRISGPYSAVIYPASPSNPGSSATCVAIALGWRRNLNAVPLNRSTLPTEFCSHLFTGGGFCRRSPQPSSDLAAPSCSKSRSPRSFVTASLGAVPVGHPVPNARGWGELVALLGATLQEGAGVLGRRCAPLSFQ